MDNDPSIVSELFETFAHDRRRRTLARLADRPRMTVAELARTLDGGRVPVDRRRLRVELHHVHVPKLVASGLVRYDPDGDVVALTDRGRRVESWLAEACERLPEAVTSSA